MFQQRTKRNRVQSAISMAELIFHSTAHNIRKGHSNAMMSILGNVLKMFVMLAVFFFMFSVLGLRRTAIRGDFLLFMLSGVFLYMTHVRSVASVMGSDASTSAMMKHAPMNTIVSMVSGALSTLYVQMVTLLAILFVYHTAFHPFTIFEPIGAMAGILMAWFYGIAVGTVFMALKPWLPEFTTIASLLYTRANMIASGKMFVVNQIPSNMRSLFDWNPLFHIIDQTRGHVFINYFPRYTNLSYAFYVALAVLCIGLIGEFYTRRRASISWSARR